MADTQERDFPANPKVARKDAINPSHYRSHPSGIEAIQVTEHLNFCIGNAVKYLWRAGLKGDAVEDLTKAKWYIEREIARLTLQNHPKGADNAAD